MKKIIILVAIIILAAVVIFLLTGKVKFPSLGSATPTPAPADKQLNIFIRDSKFLPNSSAMTVGIQVTWYNDDNKTHRVAGDGWSSGDLAPGKTFSKVFSQPGDYKYYCSIHPAMTGEIIVQ